MLLHGATAIRWKYPLMITQQVRGGLSVVLTTQWKKLGLVVHTNSSKLHNYDCYISAYDKDWKLSGRLFFFCELNDFPIDNI